MQISFDKFDDIGILALEKAPSNSLSINFLKKLLEALKAIEERKDVQVIVISSRFNHLFSSGLDLKSFLSDDIQELLDNIYTAVELVYSINKTITASEKIYIASVCGAAIGSAASITFSCDFRFGTNTTWFWLPDPQYGGLLADGGIELLDRLIGLSRAKMLALTNKRIGSKEALDWGILQSVTAVGELSEYVLSQARNINQYSWDTLAYTKKFSNKGVLQEFDADTLKKHLKSKEIYSRLSKYFKNDREIKNGVG